MYLKNNHINMTETQLTVSWDAYQKSVCKGLSFMQEHGEFVDMTLAADGHYVKVHRMVLSLISPYIKDLITSVDCPHPVIFLNNISHPTLCSILEYIYTGEVMVERENLKELIQAGKALHIKGLIDMASNICFDETIPDQNEETFIENLNTEALENNDIELKCQSVTSGMEDLNCETDTYENYSESNDASMCEDTSLKLFENVQVKSTVKQNFPLTGAGTVQYTMSNQGGLQLILNRYVYNMRYICKNSSRRRWNCIHYPGKMKCRAYVTTENDRVVERGCTHNHVFHDKLIIKKFRAGITFCTLKDAEIQMKIKKKVKTSDVDEEDSV